MSEVPLHLMITTYARKHPRVLARILQENSFNLKLSGSEVYCTNASLLLIKVMLRTRLVCQSVLV